MGTGFCKPLLLACFFVVALVSCGGHEPIGASNGPVSETAAKNITAQQDSVPLLVLGSFLNDQESLTLQQLQSGLNDGSILTTSDVSKSVAFLFSLKNGVATTSVSAFINDPGSRLLVTGVDSISNLLLSVAVDSVHFFKTPNRYPLWIKTSESGFNYEKSITRYVHTGVTAITRQTGVLLDRITIEDYLSNIQPYFDSPELTHISNEVSMVDDCSYASMRLQFATKKSHFEILNRLGVDIVELTGNHNLDFGRQPYLSTFEWYQQNNMRYFGAGKDPHEAALPLVLPMKDGTNVAWIGYNELCPLGECATKGPGACKYEKTLAAKTIDSLKKTIGVSYVIACVQFGETDSYSPTSSQRRICQELVDIGADVVLGSQAHQAQEIAHYKGKPVFFGLGNFLFDQIHRKGVRQAFFLECYFYKGRIIQYHPVYTFMSDRRIPTIATPEQKKEIRTAILKKENF